MGNDNDVIDMVNRNAKNAEYAAAIERAIATSTKVGGREFRDVPAERKRFIEDRDKRLRKLTILKLAAIIAAGVIAISGMIYSVDKLHKDVEVSKATSYAVSDARDRVTNLIIEKMCEHGSFTYTSDEDLVKTRSNVLEKEDFDKLKLGSNDFGEIYAVMLALGENNKDVIDKFASSIDGDMNLYKSIGDFADRIGFKDFKSFKETAEDELYKKYSSEINHKSKGGI